MIEPVNQPEQDHVNVHYDTRLPRLPWTRRVQIPFLAAAVFAVIRTLGPTLRYEVLGWQHAESVHASGKRIIWKRPLSRPTRRAVYGHSAPGRTEVPQCRTSPCPQSRPITACI